MLWLSLGVRNRGLDLGGEILAWPNNAADSHGRCRPCPSNRVTHATAKSRFLDRPNDLPLDLLL
jgi:hypothetical protein